MVTKLTHWILLTLERLTTKLAAHEALRKRVGKTLLFLALPIATCGIGAAICGYARPAINPIGLWTITNWFGYAGPGILILGVAVNFFLILSTKSKLFVFAPPYIGRFRHVAIGILIIGVASFFECLCSPRGAVSGQPGGWMVDPGHAMPLTAVPESTAVRYLWGDIVFDSCILLVSSMILVNFGAVCIYAPSGTFQPVRRPQLRNAKIWGGRHDAGVGRIRLFRGLASSLSD